MRTVTIDNRRLQQLEIMPADSGPAVSLGTPLGDLVDADWSWDGRKVLVARRPDSIHVVLTEIDPGSGRTREVLRVPHRGLFRFWPLPEGVLVLSPDGRALHRLGVSGTPDSTIPFPEWVGTVGNLFLSPDGRTAVVVGYDAAADSAQVTLVPLWGGVMERLVVLTAEWLGATLWLPDETFLVVVGETVNSRERYLVRRDGSRPVLLGASRFQDAYYRFSRDGRRGVARVENRTSDAYVVRGFRELLVR
ncbi:MAG: hypothetical protein ACT4PM_02620 [Gemmatimonadales bacterium]